MFIIEFGRSFSHTNKVEVDTCSIEVDAQGSGLAASPRTGFTEQRCNDTIRRKLERRAGRVPVDRHSIPLADVAQLVEQLIRNQQVIGSSPIFGSSFVPFQRDDPKVKWLPCAGSHSLFQWDSRFYASVPIVSRSSRNRSQMEWSSVRPAKPPALLPFNCDCKIF